MRENVVKDVDLELQQEKTMADSVIGNMEPKMRQRYLEMQHRNDVLLRQLEAGQQQLDALYQNKQDLEEELAASPLKQDAIKLYDKLSAMEEKRDTLVEEQKLQGTPQEERESLLRQVKEDNLEIATMERQVHEIKEKVRIYNEEMSQLNMDIEESQGERNQKYKELKKREETMNEFIDTFDETSNKEVENIQQNERHVVMILETMSRNLKRAETMAPPANTEAGNTGGGSHMNIPTSQDLSSMKEDLGAKEEEMGKSKSTMSGLAGEHEKLHQDLMKVDQLESKITTELSMLKERIDKMSAELVMYDDLENLRVAGEKKKTELHESKVTLHTRRRNFKLLTAKMGSDYESKKKDLAENETYAQLGNLEHKWQHYEQNNYIMKEFISSKQMECDYERVAKKINTAVAVYNVDLQTKCAKQY